MTQDKRQRIAEGYEKEICPRCGNNVADPKPRVGSGAHPDGIFCSVDCQGRFHEDYYRERARASKPSPN